MNFLKLEDFKVGMKVSMLNKEIWKGWGEGVVTAVGKVFVLAYFDNINDPEFPFKETEVSVSPGQLIIIKDEEKEDKNEITEVEN